jgi:hypothetical protein
MINKVGSLSVSSHCTYHAKGATMLTKDEAENPNNDGGFEFHFIY